MDKARDIYEQAKQKTGKQAKSLKEMALFAWEHRHDHEALEAIETAYERTNVRPYIHAVEAMPTYFEEGTASTDFYLSLFAICSLNKFDRAVLLDELRNGEMELWQVLERVKELRTPKPREKQVKTCPHCGREL